MDSHLTAPAPEVIGAGQVRPTDPAAPPLPVALRNDEITEADALALARKAAEALASAAPAKAPVRIPMGKRPPAKP